MLLFEVVVDEDDIVAMVAVHVMVELAGVENKVISVIINDSVVVVIVFDVEDNAAVGAGGDFVVVHDAIIIITTAILTCCATHTQTECKTEQYYTHREHCHKRNTSSTQTVDRHHTHHTSSPATSSSLSSPHRLEG